MWTSLPLASSSSAVGLISGSCPSARVFAPRFLQTPPRDGSPCASLSLLLHQDVKRTYTPKRSIMHGVIGIGGRVTSPPLPHHRTSGSASGGSMGCSPAALHRGRRFKERTADGGFAARRVPLQASPAPNSLKLNPKADWLAHGHI